MFSSKVKPNGEMAVLGSEHCENSQDGCDKLDHKSKNPNVAKLRWKMLSKVIVKQLQEDTDRAQELDAISIRRFSNFGLFSVEPTSRIKRVCTAETEAFSSYNQFQYECKDFPSASAVIRHLVKEIDLKDLLGFNNTGNICIWPSEEVLGYYCIKHKEKFRGSRICELGGGMSALAGIMVSVVSDAEEVLLTDGNQQCVDNIQAIVEENKSSFGSTKVLTRKLLWDTQLDLSEYENHFDHIICADCLFFEDCHYALVHVLKTLIKPQGQVIMFAPTRGQSQARFKELAEKDFEIDQVKNYDEQIWNKHLKETKQKSSQYDANLHFPIMMVLKPRTL